jgi:putative ABC transport system permease protein
MSNLSQDIRVAWRIGRRAPAATLGLLVTMAVAVAGCATVFAVVNAVLVRPFPFPDAARLVHVQGLDATGSNRLLSAPTWDDWKASVRGVALAAFSDADFSITDSGEPETLVGGLVTPELLDVLGVTPMYGRAFQRDDTAAGERTVILTHAFWTRRFGADPSIVGKVINLSGPEHMEDVDGAYRVVGIMPRQFWLFWKRLDVLVPFKFSAGQKADRKEGVIQNVIGRVSGDRAMAMEEGVVEIESVARRVFERHGSAEPVAAARTLDLRAWHFGALRPRLMLLVVAAVTVLLLAAINIAGLLAARMIGRQHEFGIRLALGASRLQLIRQMVVEALVFGAIGGLLGIAPGMWAIALVRNRLPVRMIGRLPGEAAAIGLEPAVVAILVLAVVAVSILSGVAAALLLGLARDKDFLNAGTKGGTAPPRRLRLRAGMTGLQVAMSASLVLTTLVLAENQRRLAAVDLGVSPGHVVSYWLNPPRLRYPTPANRAQFYEAAIARTRALPGIERVGGIDVPFHMDRPRLRIMKDGRTTDSGEALPTVLPRAATTDYFTAMGIRLLEGRLFEALDVPGSQPVAVVSRGAANLLWPGEDAIGRTVRPGGPASKEPWSTVVGIVDDVRGRPHEAPLPIVYRPVAQKPPAWLYLIVRTHGEPAAHFTSIPRAVWAVDDAQPIDGPFLASTWVANLLVELRLSVNVAWMFAALALVLSMAGLYGLTAHAIGQATRDIGILKALGATDRIVTNQFVGRVALVTVPAVCAGMLASIALVWGIGAEIEGLTFVGLWWLLPACAAIFCVVCFAAAYVPLRRIAAVDPALSMRAE